MKHNHNHDNARNASPSLVPVRFEFTDPAATAVRFCQRSLIESGWRQRGQIRLQPQLILRNSSDALSLRADSFSQTYAFAYAKSRVSEKASGRIGNFLMRRDSPALHTTDFPANGQGGHISDT